MTCRATCSLKARFYDPHDVTQLSSDRIMLIDDGNNRAGCISNDDDDYASGCYTRAVQARVGDRSRAVFPTPAQSSRGTPRSGRRAHTL